MGQTCSLPRLISDFEVPHLKLRNSYGETNEISNDKVLKSIFPQTYEQNRRSKILSMIQSNR
jgi:hypothetical protein